MKLEREESRLNRSVLVFVVCLASCLGAARAYGCTNHRGEEVDWYVALRVPSSRRYLVFQRGAGQFEETDEQLLAEAIGKLSFTENKLLVWNDQTVDGTASTTKAHSKGFLHYQPGKNGFLFLHSIPHFIDTTDNLFKSKTRETSSYGQSLVCVTLSSPDQVQTAINHAVAQFSNFYEDTFGLPKREKPAVQTMVADFPFGFTLITKTSESDEHPFEDMLVKHFKVGWLVNTWSRPYKSESCGSAVKVSNVIFKSLGGFVSKSTQDHSKWALSYGDQRRIVCVGDLNHMESQAKRGGSFLCIDDASLYREMFAFLLNDSCQIAQNFTP